MNERNAHRPTAKRRESDAGQARPFIRDTWPPVSGPGNMTVASVGFVLLALVAGFAIGFAVFTVMSLSTWLTKLIWTDLAGAVHMPAFPLFTCTIGGLFIGLWTHFSQNRIAPLERVMGEFRRTGRFELHGASKTAVSFLLPLTFGGSVGFEAGLTGMICAGCCWIRDKLKAAGLREAHLVDVTIAASLSAIFGAPFAGVVAGAESMPLTASEGGRADDADATSVEPPVQQDGDSAFSPDGADAAEPLQGAEPASEAPRGTAFEVDAYDMRRSVKLVLYLTAAVGAFAGVELVASLFGGTSGLPRFDAIQATGGDLLWALPCLLGAWVLTLAYHGSNRGFYLLAERLGKGPRGTVAAPVIAGAVLGTCAMAFPQVLFPGETQSHELMGTWQTWTAAALLCTAVLKAAATPMCIRMGWMGGSFFPCIFSGVACGYGIAALTGTDPMLAVAVTTSAFLAGATRKPLLSVAILALCFPLSGILWSGLAAVVGGSLPVPRSWLQEER